MSRSFPVQTMQPAILAHITVPQTDVAICGPMRVGDYSLLPEGTLVIPCPACFLISFGRIRFV